MERTVLHVSAQRPGLTGSGVTLDALIRCAAQAGWSQVAVVGVPADESETFIGGLPRERIRPLMFGTDELNFPVPGMSDVMPYLSSRYSKLTDVQLEAYRCAWRDHLLSVIEAFQPDVIHAHHVWLLGSLLRDVAPDIPIVTHCHATGFRQMALCPHLAFEVRGGCRRNDRFCALHEGHAEELSRILDVEYERIKVVGGGYRDDIFHARGLSEGRENHILYIGKSSSSKGVPWLLDAIEDLAVRHPNLVLHMAGSGVGVEADMIHQRIKELGGLVVHHGQLAQVELADLMQQCSVCVLPSFYEGVPLVLVEALACGCRLVTSRLPGIVNQLVPSLGHFIELVPLPRMETVDVPHEPDLPDFVKALSGALERTMSLPLIDVDSLKFATALGPFTWARVFEQVESMWLELLGEQDRN
jgi:glycosyltransferase involved in cell wall biosynthesis